MYQNKHNPKHCVFLKKCLSNRDWCGLCRYNRNSLAYKKYFGSDPTLRECECGSQKHGWPHSTWCPKYEDERRKINQ